MFALVDCNNFYASCERVFRPDLRGKPVVVLSNNDGCVIARSEEAKQVGIPMGAPAFEFADVFKKHGVHVFSANFSLYGDMSQRVMDILSGYAPSIEVYSIDEAFMDLRGMERFDLEGQALSVRRQILQWTGIPISLGIAPTKSLAKVANRIAKKFPVQTKGVYVIQTEEQRIKALRWLKIEDVWGIGRRHSKRLMAQGVYTAYDFTQLPDEWVRKQMSVVGYRLKRDLSGIPTFDLEVSQPKKNIATTRSFDNNYTTFDEVRERIVTFAVTCAEKLRQQRSCCQSLMVFIHTNGFREDLPQYSRNVVVKLPFATNSAIEISRFAVQALRLIFREGYTYKKAGVIVQDFVPESISPGTLFEERDKRHIPLMRALDGINAMFGQQKVRLAAQDQKRIWKMRQERLSPRYTTHLDEVMVIKV